MIETKDLSLLLNSFLELQDTLLQVVSQKNFNYTNCEKKKKSEAHNKKSCFNGCLKQKAKGSESPAHSHITYPNLVLHSSTLEIILKEKIQSNLFCLNTHLLHYPCTCPEFSFAICYDLPLLGKKKKVSVPRSCLLLLILEKWYCLSPHQITVLSRSPGISKALTVS